MISYELFHYISDRRPTNNNQHDLPVSQSRTNEERAKRKAWARQEQKGETEVVDEEDSDGGTQGTGDAHGQGKITEALSTVGLRTDIGNQRVWGRVEEGKSHSMKDPHDQKRPERRSEKIGEGS